MKRFLICAAVIAVVGGVAAASEKTPDISEFSVLVEADSTAGNLDGSATFDRRFLVTYDGTCNAASSDSSNDGTSYQVFDIWSPTTEPLVAEVVLGTLGDSVLFLYCDPFDPLNPADNLVAWDDDDGVGLGSAFTAGDGFMIDANTPYQLVVAGYGSSSLGDFTLTLGGDAVFGLQPTPTPSGPQPVPTMSTGGIMALVLILAGVAVLILIRRR